MGNAIDLVWLLVALAVMAGLALAARDSRGRRGFTVMEVLCACTVIALLAALWFPVFAAAKEKARQATCQSNLRQLGAGFRMAVDDRDGRFPDAGLYARNPDASWVAVRREYQIDVRGGVLWAYIQETRVFRCPTYANPAAAAACSYAMNYQLGLLPEAGVAFPTRCLLLIEEAENSARGPGTGGLNDGAFVGVSAQGVDRLATYHHGGGGGLFVDGHVRWLTPQAVEGGSQSMNRIPPALDPEAGDTP